MLTNREFEEKTRHLIQKVPADVRDRFQADIELLRENGVDDYQHLRDAIADHSLSPHVRAVACWLAARIGDEDGLPGLLVAAHAQAPDVRRQAIQALGELNLVLPEVLNALHHALFNDVDSEVRKTAAYALGLLAASDSLDWLLKTIVDPDEVPGVRGMAVEAAINFHDHSVVPILIKLLSDKSAEVRFWSAFALGQLGAQEAVPELERLAREDHTEVESWHRVSKEAADALNLIRQGPADLG